MTAARAAAAEPRHIRGGAGGVARVRPRRPQRRAVQTVEIPERVYRGSHYSDAFIKAWAKMAALDVDTNPEHCNAGVETMARFCGLSLRDFQRALTEGRTPGPDGGAPEFSTRRMTRKSGKGRTAIRQVRPVVDGERYVTVSVAMCDALDPRRLRAALLMAHTAKYQPGYQPTAAELAGELFHHHGKSAGKPLSERTARRIVHDLEATGWVSVGHRTGHQGRHTVAVNTHPILAEQLALDLDTPTTAVDDPAAAGQCGEGSADNHGGSGPATGGGSLAIKEYTGVPTDAVAAPQEVRGSRRRRVTVSEPATDATDLADGTFGPGASRAPRGTRPTPKPTGQAPYGGPELRWTERIHVSLAPVRHLLQQPDANRFLLRKVAREIGRQLDQAAATLMTPERMAARIATRYRDAGPIRDIAAWLLAIGVVHRGCGQPLCEDGQLWPTGATCESCTVNRQATSEHWRRAHELNDRLAELRAHRQAEGEQLPAKATYRQRAAASDADVLAVAATHGPAAALHRYGVLRAAPLLRDQYGHLPAAVGATPPRPPQPHLCARPLEEAPMPDHGYMPDQIRAQLGRTTTTGALAVACPQTGCLAEAGQPCTSGRGRRRDPHEARTTAAQTR
ncbi:MULTISPECIES: zinc finger domain-containing protein [Streptomyces]|uniref:DNA-binding phage zinc finger domain-containing protein n=1 Tax=Streptomyces europaeiscabiei TaxID=146819 RepID=A0ABU4NQJ9_9ACTN|nr:MULTISPECIES: hypothetical protein [Streptomyces]MBP5922141.1 hypothetical protein [Streptomyces sp. LBUM 1483]MDX3555227.1 hypothetical protein [Streptomyces europaeiscabiei]MDX3705241.1 hypothetical protein [Streptomyces europaeiscabiei]MDX3864348.1 hypothetical protein [Streptomyces europaeiscabiei]MDX3871570.1 hypothetical protein [Streptomyces europaeiscabiei]